MLGIIPSGSKTYEVDGYLDTTEPTEGKIYVDRETGLLYYYSTTETRPNANIGFFPIWDGKKFYLNPYHKELYLKDVAVSDVGSISSTINGKVANEVQRNIQRSVNTDQIVPVIREQDNMFVQCIKEVISVRKITLGDLYANACPPLKHHTVDNYYDSLPRVTFMRLEKWDVWIGVLLKMQYILRVFDKDGTKELVSYRYPENEFNTGIVKFDDIVKSDKDQLKKMILVVMRKANITKQVLTSKTHDDYTVNNMMTVLYGNKPFSAQLFTRFIRMADLHLALEVYDKEELLVTYRE